MKKWFLNNYKNYLCLILGIVIMAFSSVFFNNSHFGSDAIYTLNQGLSKLTHLDTGITNIIIGVIAFIVLLIIDRKAIGVGTFLMAIFLGLIISLLFKINIVPNLSYEYIESLSFIPTVDFISIPKVVYLLLQLLYTILAIVLGGFGVALYIYGNRGISPLEGILIKIQKVSKVPFWVVKIINDIIFYAIGLILGATFGIGSLIAAFTYGPMISFFGKLLKKSNIIKEEEKLTSKDKRNDKKNKTNKKIK